MKRTALLILLIILLVIGAVIVYIRRFEVSDTAWMGTQLLSSSRTSVPFVPPLPTHQNELATDELSTESTKTIDFGNHTQRKYQPLPSSVIDRIKVFVLFVGHARSGHSIVGSILDGHPHIVIADESNILKKVSPTTSKPYLYNRLWHNSYWQASGGLRTTDSTKKGYSLALDGTCQGLYRSYIEVIGDKKGDMNSKLFAYNSKRFENTIKKLRSIINVPIKLFHVIRNPYDNIATSVLYERFKPQIAAIKRSNKSITVNPNIVDSQIKAYFYKYRAAEGVKQVMPDHETMEVHGKDLISDPKAVISDMCKYLEVHCSDDYLNVVSKQVFGGESKTRYKIKWEDYQVLKVKEHLSEFDNLKRYIDFDS